MVVRGNRAFLPHCNSIKASIRAVLYNNLIWVWHLCPFHALLPWEINPTLRYVIRACTFVYRLLYITIYKRTSFDPNPTPAPMICKCERDQVYVNATEVLIVTVLHTPYLTCDLQSYFVAHCRSKEAEACKRTSPVTMETISVRLRIIMSFREMTMSRYHAMLTAAHLKTNWRYSALTNPTSRSIEGV